MQIIHGSRRGRARRDRRGAAILVVAFLVAALAAYSLSMLSVSQSAARARRAAREEIRALYVAEAGLSEAVLDLSRGEDGNVGSEGAAVVYGSGSYWVVVDDLGNDTFSLVATGVDDRAGARVELVLREVSTTIYSWAAFGDEGLTTDSNARIDSYDSRLGSYGDQAVNNDDGHDYALENGHVGSNQNVALAMNSFVHGNATPGPAGTTTITGNAAVTGSTTPAPEPLELEPLEIPAIPSSGPLTVTGTETLPSGQHCFDAFVISSNAQLNVIGPATLVLDSASIKTNAKLIVDATDGPVEIYVLNDFVMSSSTLVASTTYTPADIVLYLQSDNVLDPDLIVDLDEVDFESNAKLFGTIYAPNAAIEIDSNFELFGALVARSVHLDSNARIHFDEALLDAMADSQIAYETVCWRILPYSPN